MTSRPDIGTQASGLRRLSWAAALACLAACASNQTVMIHEGPTGAVYLEEVRKGPLAATHPISLGPDTLERVLKGVLVRDDTRMLQDLMPGKEAPEPAFSEREVAFLTPSLHEALTRATPAQVVRFAVVRDVPSGKETTGGALYVKHQSIYLTLTRYRARPSKAFTAIKSDRLQRDATGLKDRVVLFVPTGITRTDLEARPSLVGPPHLTTLVLDYRLLDRVAGLEPEGGAGASSVEERLAEQERKIEALKEELRTLQRDRRDRPAGARQPSP